jgi:hypothetical protein
LPYRSIGALRGRKGDIMTTMAYEGATPPTYPVQVECEIPERHSRLTTFFRWLLTIPHYIVLGLLGYVAGFLLFVAWVVIVITARHPRSIWNFQKFYIGWSANYTAYATLMRDEFPPFGAEPYDVEYSLEYPERQSRLTVFFRWLLIIPHAIVLIGVDLVWFVMIVIAWFAILITGKYPNGFKNYAQGALRWNMRVNSYMFLMRDEYPPFSFRR